MLRVVTLSIIAALSFAHKQITEYVEEVQAAETGSTEPAATIEVKKDFNWFIMTYQMESIAILILLGAVAFMFIGKSRNY